jgi:hypothetical protein
VNPYLETTTESMELDAKTKAPTTNQREEAASAAAKMERELTPAERTGQKTKSIRSTKGAQAGAKLVGR